MSKINNTSGFMHETSKVSRTIGRDAGIEVVFAGDTAKTDGNTIYMPSLPTDHHITDEQAGALRGYADHESFHVRKTDMDLWQRTMKAAEGSEGYEKFVAWAQAIEDMRIEQYGTAEYPGAKRNIGVTVEQLAATNQAKLREKPELGKSVDAAGPLAVTLEGRRRMEIATRTTTETLDMLDADVRSVANGVVDYINKHLRDGKEGTDDTLRLAYYVAKHGTPPPPETPPPSLPAAGKGEGKGDDSGEGSGDGEGGSAGDSGGKGKDGRPTTSKGPKTSEAGDLNTELGDVAESAAKEVLEAKRVDRLPPLTVYNRSRDAFYLPGPAGSRFDHTNHTFACPPSGGLAAYEKSVTRSAGSLSVMRRKLERMVLAKANRGWERGLESGALDPKRLTMAAMGVPTVWRRREAVPEIDTSVLILIDLSGSMGGGGKAPLAQDVAIALSSCLTTINIDHAVVGFGNRGLGSDDLLPGVDRHAAPNGMPWGRTEPLIMPIFKDFGQPLRTARPALGMIQSCIAGNNSDPCAIAMAWDKLRPQLARRRIMLTISDGDPCWNCSHGYEVMYGWTKAAVQRVVREGGEIAGIGLLDDSVKRFYPIWTVASTVEEFAGRSMDMLARMLLGERVRVSAEAA